MRISFGEFTLDTDQRRLFGADEIHLSPKAFELLKILVDNRPKALSKDEFFKHLWPDTFVTENNLATLVADLRAALKDDAQRPRFIRTVYGFGYAFTGTAVDESEPRSPSSGWKLVWDGGEVELTARENILGRTGPGVIVLESPTISRHHARITIAGDRARIEDLGSKNGTWVRNQPVTSPVDLHDGDELRLGSVLATVRFSPGTGSTETVQQTGV